MDPSIHRQESDHISMVYATETAYENNYTEKVKAISRAAELINTESAVKFLVENNVTYVYSEEEIGANCNWRIYRIIRILSLFIVKMGSGFTG